MIQHDEVLQELQEKVARRRKLSGMMEDLNAQRRQLLPQLEQLDRIRIKEQQDVDKLEGRSLAAFFYNIIIITLENWTSRRTKSGLKLMPPPSNMTPPPGNWKTSRPIWNGILPNTTLSAE